MYHRYGRHGPQAWLRWYKRRYRQPMPLLPTQADPTVIRIRLPINAERIIFIIMGFDNLKEEGTQDLLNDASGKIIDSLSEPNLEGKIDAKARKLAAKHIGVIEEEHDGKRYVLINEEEKNKRLRKSAVYYLGSDELNIEMPKWDEREKLIARFRTTYDEYFRVRIRSSKVSNYILDARSTALREMAAKDKDRGVDEENVEYIGVIRSIQVLRLDLDTAIQDIANVKDLVSRYRTFYTNPGEEEEWPNEATSF